MENVFWEESMSAILFIVGFLVSIALAIIIAISHTLHQQKVKFSEIFTKKKGIVSGAMRAQSPQPPTKNANYVDALADIHINEFGFSNDRWLTKAQVVNILNHRWAVQPKQEKSRLRLLCFSDIIIPDRLANDCNRTIELLQSIYKCPIQLDWVLSEKIPKENFSHYTEQLHIQCHKIYRPHAFVPMGHYDMILHPYSGLDSSYEIIVRLIKQLKEDVE